MFENRVLTENIWT